MSQPDPTEPGQLVPVLRDANPGGGPAGSLAGIGGYL